MSGNNNNDRNNTRRVRLEVQLNLSLLERMEADAEHDSDSSSPSSCVSLDGRSSGGGSPGSKSPMVIGACTRCLMYCMVAKKDYPTCINCRQPCLVDLLDDGGNSNRGKRK